MKDDDGIPSRARRRQAERLRARFPGAGVHHPSLVDKDQDHLTSDRRKHLPERTFFLGEVFRSRLEAGGRETWPPALVTRRQRQAFAPVELAPVAKRREGNESDPWVFVPEGLGGRIAENSVFLLLYRRPVPREEIRSHLDTLPAPEKARLSAQLAKLERSLD